MKRITGYEVIFRRFENDALLEHFSMCASKSKRLCEQYMENEAFGWEDYGWVKSTNARDFIVLRKELEEIELEILATIILE